MIGAQNVTCATVIPHIFDFFTFRTASVLKQRHHSNKNKSARVFAAVSRHAPGRVQTTHTQ